MSNQNRITIASDAAKAQIDIVARKRRAFYYICALLLGAGLGLMGLDILNNIVDFVATAFTRMFSFLAVPIIALSLINTLSSLNRSDGGRLIFRYTIFYTLLTTILAACVAAALFILIAPTNVPSEMAGTANVEGIAHNSYLKYLLDVIPNNIIQPFVSGNVLSVLLIAAAVGLGLAVLPESRGRTAVKDLLSGLQELFFLFIHYLVLILPIGIVAFTAQLTTQIKAGIILGGIAQYFTAIIGANLLQFFVILPIILLLSGLNPIKIFRGMLPALAIAHYHQHEWLCCIYSHFLALPYAECWYLSKFASHCNMGIHRNLRGNRQCWRPYGLLFSYHFTGFLYGNSGCDHGRNSSGLRSNRYD